MSYASWIPFLRCAALVLIASCASHNVTDSDKPLRRGRGGGGGAGGGDGGVEGDGEGRSSQATGACVGEVCVCVLVRLCVCLWCGVRGKQGVRVVSCLVMLLP